MASASDFARRLYGDHPEAPDLAARLLASIGGHFQDLRDVVLTDSLRCPYCGQLVGCHACPAAPLPHGP